MGWIVLISCGLAVIALDQWSKAAIMRRPDKRSPRATWHFGFRRMINRRGGPLNLSPRAQLALWVLLVAALAAAASTASATLARAGIGAALGGATSNLCDRMRHGAVIDFIALGPWPVFNVADAAIVAGVALMILAMR